MIYYFDHQTKIIICFVLWQILLIIFGWSLHSRFCKKKLREPVSIHYGEDGKADGILVQTMDDSFIIDLHDAEEGRKMTWNEAMEKYEDVMPTKQHAFLICAYLKKINALLKDAGGDVLQCWYWTKTQSESSARTAWYFSGYPGCFALTSKYFSSTVRPIRNY